MDILGPATQEDMILEFVRAERDSPRQGGAWYDPVQLLAATRGYPDQYLFTGFPSGTIWSHVLLARAEVASRARPGDSLRRLRNTCPSCSTTCS
jgi:hypothetical protein